jgi:hypothetical protein
MSNIPIFINNRNRLFTTKVLVTDLHDLGYTNISILDNASTYEPLLEWYESTWVKKNVVIIYCPNYGHTALWQSNILAMCPLDEFVVYTDSDIELNENALPGFIEQMITVAKDFRVDKVGLALRIDNLPDNPFCNKIKQIEGKYWKERLPHNIHEVYNALTDTTFHVLKKGTPYSLPAVRIAGQGFTCLHKPWYNDFTQLSEEEKYVMEHADESFSSYKKLLKTL